MTFMGHKSRAPRTKRKQQAWLVADEGFAMRPCIVIDMSDGGARLELDAAERLPRFFRLIFSRTTRAGPQCEMRWRRGRSVGVKFLAAARTFAARG
jgi:hypothetical protein